jgi:hypothetical protein
MINIPAGIPVHLTITAYDMGSLPVPSQYLKVVGTKGNQMTLINGTSAMSDNISQQWENNVSSVTHALHTFTVMKGSTAILNIPVVAGDTEIATFILNSPGVYSWQCYAPCGTGSAGWNGPMSTSGWMSGSLAVD